MIIVRLMGGLGNQMFQYATAKSLALRNKDIIKFDKSFFSLKDVETPRKYELYKLNVEDNLASEEEIAKLRDHKRTLIQKLMGKLGFPTKRSVIEQNMEFIPELLHIKGDIYLDGYWQTEKYFKQFRQEIVQDFQVKKAPDEVNQKMLDLITASQNSVSIHVRRGDYITGDSAKIVHGSCSPEYYANSIKMIKEKVSNPTFFVFSDEPDWAKENIKTDTDTYVSYNSVVNQDEDLRLMYSCKHHIVANSSFSWWGAWLSTNPVKLVCAPEQWFANKTLDSSHIIPESWTKITG